MANQLFNQLKNGLRNTSNSLPECSTVAIGFTSVQILKMNFKNPRLLFYDSDKKAFFDQGDSTKIEKSKWCKITKENYKKDKLIKNVKYYIPLTAEMVEESNKF